MKRGHGNERLNDEDEAMETQDAEKVFSGTPWESSYGNDKWVHDRYAVTDLLLSGPSGHSGPKIITTSDSQHRMSNHLQECEEVGRLGARGTLAQGALARGALARGTLSWTSDLLGWESL